MGLTFIDITHFSIHDKNIKKYVLCLSGYKDKHIIKVCVVRFYFSKHLFSSDIFMCVCLHVCARVCRCTKGQQLESTCEAHHVAFLLCFISETESPAALEIHQFPRTNGRVRPRNLFTSALSAQAFVPPPARLLGLNPVFNLAREALH